MEHMLRAGGMATLAVLALPLLAVLWLAFTTPRRGGTLLLVLLAIILGVQFADRLGAGDALRALIFLAAGAGRP